MNPAALHEPNSYDDGSINANSFREDKRKWRAEIEANDSLSYIHTLSDRTVNATTVMLEVCCGSAKLSLAAKLQGMYPIPIDWTQNKQKLRVPCVKLDMSCRSQVDILRKLLDQGQVAVIWAAVPCGTCSRAREIHLPGKKRQPKPLRSAEFPGGLPDLGPDDAARVKKANEIYDAVAELLQDAINRGIYVVVENPRGSWLWQYSWYRDLLKQPGFFDADFQHCKWTPTVASRPKWTRLRTNVPQLAGMEGLCEQDHVHLGWGVDEAGNFNTSKETEYPDGMCDEAAGRLAEAVKAKGFELKPMPQETFDTVTPHKLRRVDKQPRGKLLPPVISEFGKVIQCTLAEAKQAKAKILRLVDSLQEKKGGSQMQGVATVSKELLDELPDSTLVMAGFFRSPEEFFDEAKLAVHPMDLDGAVPDELTRAVVAMLQMSPEQYVEHLLKKSRELIKLVQDNRAEDAEYIEKLRPEMAKVMGKKKFATMKHLLMKMNAAGMVQRDLTIIDEMIEGFPLTGMAPFKDAFKYEVKLPTMTEKELRASSWINNKALLDRIGPSRVSEHDDEIWRQAEQEFDAGWLLGPFENEQQVSQMLGEKPHFSRRFPLAQGSKIRAIDDMLESNVNAAWGSCEKLDLLDADTMAALARLIEKIYLRKKGTICLRDGSHLDFSLHREWQNKGGWMGRTVDLKSAYKQLCSHPKSWFATVLLIFEPSSRKGALAPEVVLPFGSASSVLHFNRAARYLWRLGCVEFFFSWGNFFDDYPTYVPQCVAKAVQAAIFLLLKSTGWEYSDKDGKDLPFAELFAALGIRFNVGNLHLSQSTVENKPERVKSVVETVKQIIENGTFNHFEAEELRGKNQFMEKSIFGRAGRCIVQVYDRRGKSKLDDEDVKDLKWLVEWLETAKPRKLTPMVELPTVLLFTDGACEPNLVSCGAVLYDPLHDEVLMFGFEVNELLVQEWRTSGKEQLVTEAELLPQLVARVAWGDRLLHRKVINFVDSNPALYACIKGNSPALHCNNIVKAISIADVGAGIWPWYTRVPSLSNCADAPSRLKGMPQTWNGLKVIECKVQQPTSLLRGKWAGSSAILGIEKRG